MARKPLKKSSKTWKCPHKCEVTPIPCVHLEALLNKGTSKVSADLYYYSLSSLDWLSSKTKHTYADMLGVPEEQALPKFLLFLKEFCLSKYETDILVARFVYGRTFKQIAKEQYWTTQMSCYRFLVRTLEILKERMTSLQDSSF